MVSARVAFKPGLMARPNDHNKVIATVAKAALAPLGFRRKGASRIWFADKGYWLLIVEFQHSAWSRGSYLNVAAHWLWTSLSNGIAPAYLFDYGDRVGSFISFQNEAQFREDVAKLGEMAASEARRLGNLFNTLEAIADCLVETEQQAQAKKRGGHWGAFHAGVAAGLTGRTEIAMSMFDAVQLRPEPEGSILHSLARTASHLLGDDRAFRLYLLSFINDRRAELKLSPLDIAALGAG